MKNNIFILVFCFPAYFPKATTDSETVWLKDITARLQTDKRTLIDSELPDQLSFLLKRKSHTLTLNLKRNYDIDPNADIYTVRTLDDGRSFLEKTENVEKEDVAYYQDRENEAFMTVSCVKRSNGQCDIVINGNIRIGGKNYDLRPSQKKFTSRIFWEITDFLGKRYVLQEQSNIDRDISLIQDLSNVDNDMSIQQDQLNIERDQSFLQDQAHIERDKTLERKDKIKKEYIVKVLVVLDSSVWDLFISLVKSSLDITKLASKAEKNMRRYYSHIMNGVDHLYKGIDDLNIAIRVKMRTFVIFQWETQFPHNFSRIHTVNGRKMIDGGLYMTDLANWDLRNSYLRLPVYDQIILFTRYTMYLSGRNPPEAVAGGTASLRRQMIQSGMTLQGLSLPAKVCLPGYRVALVHSSDYFITTSIAAHELGHSLGASHDGEGHAIACKAEDGFIMTPVIAEFDPSKNYSKNPWLFSKCSVKAFKETLANKDCLSKPPNYNQTELDEWNKFMMKLPGEKYTPSMQCQIIVGRGSTYCGVLPGRICQFMYCTHPTTFKCVDTYFSAAPGTTCGINMWCREGLCVKKGPK